VGVFLAVERGFGGLVVFEGIEVFQEEQPRGLLGVVEFAGATGIFPEDIIDVFEGLFEHAVGESGTGEAAGHRPCCPQANCRRADGKGKGIYVRGAVGRIFRRISAEMVQTAEARGSRQANQACRGGPRRWLIRFPERDGRAGSA